jgi:hypothetical protein
VGPGSLFIDGQPVPLSLHSTAYTTLTSVPPAAAPAPQPSSLTAFNMWLADMAGVEQVTLGGWYDVADSMRGHHQPGLVFWKLEVSQQPGAGPLARCMALVSSAADWITLTRSIAPASFPTLQPLQPFLGAKVSTTAAPLLNSTLLLMELGVTRAGNADAYVANVSRAEPSVVSEAGFNRAGGGGAAAYAACTAGVDVAQYLAQSSQLPEPIWPWDCTAWGAPVAGMRLYCLDRYEQDMAAAEQQALAELQRQEVG